MGNRACVLFTNHDESVISPICYLHWNGGAESVYAFLAELQRRNVRNDIAYAAARFVHVVGDYFDQGRGADGLSLGLYNAPPAITAATMSPFAQMADDNGVFVINLGKEGYGGFEIDKVRRFVAKGDDCRELTRRAVVKERAEAMQHPYNTGRHQHPTVTWTIASQFIEMRPLVQPGRGTK